MLQTADFDFDLPPELIAQTPAFERDLSRLLVLHRASQNIEHRTFRDLMEHFNAGDVLVLNNSRVLPARLRGINVQTGGQFEILLVEENAVNDWWVMLRPGRRARVGTQIALCANCADPSQVRATVLEKNEEGHCRLSFTGASNISNILEQLGEVPLPPYIRRADSHALKEDRERYQTTFATLPGSVAAPTAGLHFTRELLDEIRTRGVQVCFLTLHVGLGTFTPVKTKTIAAHRMHEERFELSEETIRMINDAKRAGHRILAVGTTTVRVLEGLAATPSQASTIPAPQPPLLHHSIPPFPVTGKTRIFIYPPYGFRIVDALLTNFHLPRSTLLMLASAFASPNNTHGRELILSAYAEAIRRRYRFFSYGDAMLIL
jgi:S-adenosylmethionine:tRNA ribosyltransferase-isomerase